jgi:hypothetical protein
MKVSFGVDGHKCNLLLTTPAPPVWRTAAWMSWGSAFAVVLLAATLTDRMDWPEGTTERLVTMLLLSGLATSAGLAWWNAGHRVGSRPVRQILAFALTAVAGALTGVSATAIAPVRAETRHYAASVSLDPDPLASASLVAPTVFGDIDVAFRGCPGHLGDTAGQGFHHRTAVKAQHLGLLPGTGPA